MFLHIPVRLFGQQQQLSGPFDSSDDLAQQNMEPQVWFQKWFLSTLLFSLAVNLTKNELIGWVYCIYCTCIQYQASFHVYHCCTKLVELCVYSAVGLTDLWRQMSIDVLDLMNICVRECTSEDAGYDSTKAYVYWICVTLDYLQYRWQHTLANTVILKISIVKLSRLAEAI